MRVDCSSGTYIRIAGGRSRHRARWLRAPRGAAPPARRLVHARRGAPARSDRRRSRRASCSRRRPRCAISNGRRRRRAARARSRTARRSRRPRSARPTRAGPGPFAVVDERGELLAVYERRGAGVKPAVVLAPQERVVKVCRDPAEVAPTRRRRARGHDRRVRRRAPRSSSGAAARARPRASARARRRRCSRSTVIPAEVVRPGSAPQAAHDARPEARAARSDRRGRRMPRAHVRRGAQQGAGRRVRRGGARGRAARAARRGRRRLPLRLPPPRRRAAAAAHGRRARLRGDRARSRRVARVASAPDGGIAVLVDARRARCSRAGDVDGAAAILGRPHEVRGPGRARRRTRPRARLPDRERRGPRADLPARRRRVRRHVHRRRRRRARRRDLARPPADVLRRVGHAAARGVPARLRRRPLRPAAPGSASAASCGARSGSIGRRADRPDGRGTSRRSGAAGCRA